VRRLLLAAVLSALIVSPALAVDDAWIGTWKFDPSKSRLTGETIIFSKSRNGEYHFSDGSTFTDDFYIDGNERRSAFDRTTIWQTAGVRAWDALTRIGGKLFTSKHYELSSDEATLTVTTTGVKPDQSEFKNVAVFARVAGTKGLVGRWRCTRIDISSPDVLVLSSPAPGILRWEIIADKQTAEGRADGTPHLVSGPTVPKGLTMSFRNESATVLSYVFRVNGRPETYGLQTLAADRRSFSDVYWHPGKKREKITDFYVKQ
jgi:hypothetical protein